MNINADEQAACQRLIDWALREDLDERGDVTSQAIIPADLAGRAELVARAPGVLAGLPAAQLLFATLDPALEFQSLQVDGSKLFPGTRLARVSGSLRSILAGERAALNFLQHLSGIATRTRQYVDAVAGTMSRILDTRKTLPGWRLLEKYAVRCGGGHNHRIGLYDAILIKDNHLAALGREPNAITRAVRAARERHGHSLLLIVEIDGLHQFDEALASGADVILLDNMSPQEIGQAVARRNAAGVPVLLEVSGGVTLDTVAAIAAVNVGRISIGALTHSAPALDIALDYLS
jgi:nicotinate-nucleotide pyrophosphorylase (carboxylating)